jgi:hypothetical protein
MAQSIPSPKVIKLGKKIAKEFSRADRIHVTLGWMAHHLAETINQAETEKDPALKQKAEQESVELILKLWEHREHFPGEVRPLAELDNALAVLAALNDEDAEFPAWNRYQNIETSSPWGKFLQELRWNADHIIKVIIYTVVSMDALKREKEWLKSPELLSSKEKEIIEGLDRLIKSYGDVTVYIGDAPEKKGKNLPKKRLVAAFDKIEELLQSQLTRLAEVRAYTLKPRKRPKS